MPKSRYKDYSPNEFLQLSKRRKKIVIKRKLNDDLAPFVGMRLSDSVYKLMSRTIEECLDSFIFIPKMQSVTYNVSFCRGDETRDISVSF